MCPRGGLDDLEKRKVPCRYRDLNPRSYSRDFVVTVINQLIVTTDCVDCNNYVITARVLRCKKFEVCNSTYSRNVYFDQL